MEDRPTNLVVLRPAAHGGGSREEGRAVCAGAISFESGAHAGALGAHMCCAAAEAPDDGRFTAGRAVQARRIPEVDGSLRGTLAPSHAPTVEPTGEHAAPRGQTSFPPCRRTAVAV